MAKLTKRRKEIQKIADVEKTYVVKEAVSILKKTPHPKFDETVELAFNLGADPKQSDQMVRGTMMLPNGTGRKVRVLVLCKGEAANQAKEAGAEYVGGDDLIAKISSGWMDFDADGTIVNFNSLLLINEPSSYLLGVQAVKRRIMANIAYKILNLFCIAVSY